MHAGAFAHPTLDVEATAMAADDVLDDRQAQAGPSHAAATASIDPVKALAQARQMLRGNAFALIDHAEAKHIRAGLFECDDHLATRPTIFERVDDQIADQLEQLGAIAEDDGAIGPVTQYDFVLPFLDQLVAADAYILDQRE